MERKYPIFAPTNYTNFGVEAPATVPDPLSQYLFLLLAACRAPVWGCNAHERVSVALGMV